MNYDMRSFMKGYLTGLRLSRAKATIPPQPGTIYTNAAGTCRAIVLITHDDPEHAYAARYVTEYIGTTGEGSSARPIVYATGTAGDRLLATQYNGQGYVLALRKLAPVGSSGQDIGMAYLMGGQLWYIAFDFAQFASQEHFILSSAYAGGSQVSELTIPESTIDPTHVLIYDMHPVDDEQEGSNA